MCDCFHLAFPNWHGPATGAGRRLRGPEQDTEDDSVCEEPEILEGERPRPQGSSPVEEFPGEKQAEDDFNNSPLKSVNKKSLRVGFGSLFDKRSSAKMSETEDMQSGGAGVIVKTVKDTCAEGLVVTGGGKEGIFIKEVKPDSPASRHMTMKEGDQILSATVYFDNVSYEDALQILEHAQPYKMELCVRRKVESTLPEDDEIIQPKGNEGDTPQMRSPRKKKQRDRISWPKFPSFGKGHRAQFKRSHSTSEAEEHKKLEISPATSDTESPFKSPLKSPDGKDKKKKQKAKLNKKMKGHSNKSIEESQRNEKELTSENLIVLEDQQVGDALQENFPETPVTKLVTHEAEFEDHAFPSMSEKELQHKVHLISLSNTLKTTDISDALADGSAGETRTSEEGKIERSEMKVSIHQKKKSDVGTDSQSKTVFGMSRTSDSSAYDSVVVSPVPISQAELEIPQIDAEINTDVIRKDISEKNLVSGNMEMGMQVLDVSVDLSDVAVLKQSPKTSGEKQWKERTILENESYGIRTRGPLGDIAASKTHFASTVNGLQFTPPDSSELTEESTMPETITIIAQPKPNDLSTVCTVDAMDSHWEIKTSKQSTETNVDNILAGLDKKSKLKFKLPNVDCSGLHEPIKMTKVEQIKTHLPKREDIEIPGMEDKEAKPSLQTPGVKIPKIKKIINITKDRDIQAQRTDEEFNVEDVKEAVSKFPAFFLPEGDITGVLVQREITIMELKTEKTNTTPRGSPRKISETSADGSTKIIESKIGQEESSASNIPARNTVIKIPKVELPYADEETIAMTTINYTKLKGEIQQADEVLITDNREIADVKFKLPKREDIEIPGMEAIEESIVQNTDMKVLKDKTKKYDKQKGREKKSKKPQISMPSFGITKPDIRFPDIGIELPKKDVLSRDSRKTEETKLEVDADIKLKDASLPEHTDVKFYRMETSPMSVGGQKPTEAISHTEAISFPKAVASSSKQCAEKQPEHLKEFDDLTAKASKDAPDISVVDIKTEDIKTEGQGRKFKLPKFEISFPEVPKITGSASKKEVDNSRTERKGEVSPMHLPEMSVQTETKSLEFKIPGIKGFKIDENEPKVEAEIFLPEEKKEVEQETDLKMGASFTLPKDKLSKAETKDTEPDIPFIDLPLPVSKSDSGQKEEKFGSPTKFKLPSINLPKFRGKSSKAIESINADTGASTAVDTSVLDVQVKEGKINFPDTELQVSAEPTSKPKKLLSNTELKETAEPLSANIKGHDIGKNSMDLSVDMKFQDTENERQASKFKLPKFGIKLPEIKAPQIDLSAAKTELEISLPDRKVQVQAPDAEVPEGLTSVKEDLPEIDSKGLDVKTKRPSFSFPKFGFSKSEMKGPEADVSVPDVDVSLPEGSVELEAPNAEITVSVDEMGKKDEAKFGSPTKFKLPSIILPKIGVKAPKGKVDVSAVEIQAKGKEVSLPDAELKLSTEPLSVDIKGPELEKEDKSLRVDIKPQDIKTEGQGSKLKFPKFGISLPEVKGPKIDLSTPKTEMDVSLPERKMEVHSPDVAVTGAVELKADVLKIDSKDLDVKTNQSSFAFPKFGFSKSEMKAPEADVSVPDVEVSLPEGSVELEAPNAHITVSIDETEQKDETKFGSPTRFKLPSITLPKFGVKAPKGAADISGMEVQAKGKEVSLPDAELKLSAEPLSVDIKGPGVKKEDKSLRVDITAQDIQTEEQGRKLKFPKFGISLPEGKGPKVDSTAAKTEIDISLPEGKMEVHPPDVGVPGAIEVKADLPEIDSKDLDMKSKQPGFSFPKFGFSKSEMKAPEVDVSAPDIDVSGPEGSVELEAPNADITVSMDETGKRDETKFGSPTKFKLPSITLPKFGVKAPKGALDVSDVEVQAKGKEISLPDADIKLSSEPLSVDIKGPVEEKEDKSLRVDIMAQDTETEEQGSKLKFPKFGIKLPELKGPKIDLAASKKETDVSLPEVDMEVHPSDVEVPEGEIKLKADVPEIDSKSFDVTTKQPSFSFPKFGFSKSEIKAPEVDVSDPNVDVSLPEGRVEIEVPNADISLSVDETGQKDETKFGSATKFKLPSITLPKFGVKAPKRAADVSGVEVQAKGKEISLPDAELKLLAEPKSEGKMEVHPPDVGVPGAIKVKADVPEIDSKDLDVKTKRPSLSFPKFGFSKSEIKAPEVDVSVPNVDVSLPEGRVELEAPNADILLSVDETGQKDETKFGSPTKFKLPSITLPKFGVKAPKGAVDVSGVEVHAKGKEVSLPDEQLKLSAEPLSVDIKGPEVEKEDKSLKVDIKTQDIQTEEQKSKLKIPKFGISLPEVKGPKIDSAASKTEIDVPLPEAVMEVHPPDAEVPEGAIKLKADVPEIDSKSFGVKTKQPSFSFPKFGFSKSEMKAPEVDVSVPDVDVSLSEGRVELEAPNADITVSVDGTGKKDETKFGSPTKFKLPSITLPKFGVKAPRGAVDVSGVEVQAKGKEVSLPDADIKLSTEPLSVRIKGTSVKKEAESLRVDIKAQDILTEEQRSKFKFPKFGISLPEVKGPKIDSSAAKTETDVSLPEGKMEVHPPDVGVPGAIEVKADLPEIDFKDLHVKTKRSSLSFPRFGFSKSEIQAPEADVSAPDIDVSLPEGRVELEAPNADITVSMDGTGKTDEAKFGSPTKFKLPSITLPKFGVKTPKGAVDVSGVEVQAKGKEVSLPDAQLKLSAKPLSVDIKGPEVEKEDKSLRVDIKTQDIQTEEQGSKLKIPKFGISLPEVKGPKIDLAASKTGIDVSLPEGKMEVHPPDVEVPEGEIKLNVDIPEIDSKSFDVKTKQPSFSFPKFGFSKSEMKAPEADVSVPDVDVSVPEGSVELEGPNADITVSKDGTGKTDETKFGSPTKFKLPSITLPKFGVKAPKGAVDVSGVEVQAKGKEVSLPDAETKLSTVPLSFDIKGPGVKKEAESLRVDMKAQDIETEEQRSKFKFPKFGISLPEVKGPKIDSSTAKREIDVSLPEGMMEVHAPDVGVPGAIKVKADVPEIDSKDLDMKSKRPGFSFPKFGFSKSEIKAPEVDVSAPDIDVSLPEGIVDVEAPNTDFTLSIDGTGKKDETKFGSPTKFKLPSITLPKFGVKAPKGALDVSAVEVQAKIKEVSLPDAEIKLSSKPLSVDIKGPDVEKEDKSLRADIKAQDIQTEEQGSKLKIPKFGISLPEVKGPKTDLAASKTETDVSLPEADMEVHPPEAEVPEGAIKLKADASEIDSKSFDVKTKQPSFSFPKFGFSKSEMKAPEADVSAPNVDVSLPEGRVEAPNADITVSVDETGKKREAKFGSPTKFKLPSITLPKFGDKAPKGAVDVSAVEVQGKGKEISLPDAELKLSAEPLSVDIKGPEVKKEAESLRVDMKAQDIQTEENSSKFKFPKFGISFPEVKGPKIDSSAAKTEIDVSLPEGKLEVHPPDVGVPGAIEVKADVPDIESKDLDMKSKRPGFSFPKFGFSKSEIRAPEADVSAPDIDVSLPEGRVELEAPNADITVSVDVMRKTDETKFGSPTKFKLPSITLPKFGVKAPKGAVDVSAVEVQAKGQKVSLPDAQLKLSAEPLSVDIKGPDVKKEAESLSMDMKARDIQTEEQGSKFKFPKFGISLPEVKGPKIDSSSVKTEIDVSLPEGKMEVHPPDVGVPGAIEVKADVPDIESKDLDMKSKRPGFSFPKFGFSKSEIKAPEVDVSAPDVDLSLPEGNVELEAPNADITVSMDGTGKKDEAKFGSPTKFKLPSITLPKFGVKAPKGAVDLSGVEVQAKGREVSLPDAALKLSTEPVSVDIKGPEEEKVDRSLRVDIMAQDIQTDKQGSKLKFPKFGISLPEMKGPKIDSSTAKTKIDFSLPEGTMEVRPPDIGEPGAIEVKADVPKIDSKDLEMKTKRPGFSFPKFGFSKSEMKAPEADVSVPNVDVSVPEGSVELEAPNADITVSFDETGKKDETKFGSPTKFKLPSITLPKFGVKAQKEAVDVSGVEVQAKGKEVSLPDAEIKLSAEPLSVDIKRSEVEKEDKSLRVDVKAQDIQIEEQGSKLKFPKFGISLPELKGPKIDSAASKTEIDVSLPEGKMEVQPPDIEVREGAIRLKADLPEIDSKGLDVKTKQPDISFPKFGFSKSEIKVPEPVVNEGNADITLSMDETEQKDETKFGSPTKFKLPSITLPKFEGKAPKGAVDVSGVEVQTKGKELSLPDAELEISSKPPDLKVPSIDKQEKSLSVDMKPLEIQTEKEESKFKLPKFGIKIPEAKVTKMDSSAVKTEIDISLPEGKMEVHPSDTEVEDGITKIKQDLTEIDSKRLDVKTKQFSFSFPKFGFSKSETKNVSLPEGNVDLEEPDKDTIVSTGQKDKTKFASPTKFKLPSVTLPKSSTLEIKTPNFSLSKSSAQSDEVTVQSVDIESQETKYKENTAVTGSPVKFKLPTIKMPTFGNTSQKTSETKAEISVPEKDIADINAGTKHLKSHDSYAEVEIKDTIQQPPEAAVKKEEGDKGSPSRFKLPTIKMSKISISKTKSQDGDNDISIGANVPVVVLDSKNEDTQGHEKSSNFTVPTLGDVLRGFDVEFNVPKLDEVEEAKIETSAPMKMEYETSLEYNEKQTVVQTDQKPDTEENQTKAEKSGWFRFPKFSSPTKTAKVIEKESSQPCEKTEENSVNDNKEKVPEQTSTTETEEDSVSPTLSLRSSDAFADVSSALTTEQVGLSMASPTKVKVTFSESTATVEISDLHGDVITSTAKTELISMEPHQPEKVNIPGSSDMSSSSVDTQRQMSGEIHIVVSTVQTVPDTATINNVDTKDIQTLHLEGVAIKSDSVEDTRLPKKEHTMVERHIVKEMFCDDKGKVFVSRRMQIFEGDSAESISGDTASSIQKLRDTVHTEKMKFFEDEDSSNQNTIRNETSLRHIDSSAEENGGK